MKIISLVHPHFLVKFYLQRDIKFIAKNYVFKGKSIDIGCGEKPYRELFKNIHQYIGIDFQNYSRNNLSNNDKPDIFFPKNYAATLRLPFENNSFNHAFSFQVAEHHPDPSIFIKELVRITKKSGFILLSFPFIWGLHEEPHDYFRFTKYSIQRIFQKNNCKIIQIKKQGSIFSSISMLLNDYLIEFASRNKAFYILSIIIYPVFLFFSYISFFLDHIFSSKRIFLNYVVLAKKL